MHKAKLIFKADTTYLPTAHPAIYYGSTDRKVYVLYKRLYETPVGKSKFEFVIARLVELSYNYKEEKWIDLKSNKKRTEFFNDTIDKPNRKLKIIKICRITKTYFGAEKLLNNIIQKAIEKLNLHQSETTDGEIII